MTNTTHNDKIMSFLAASATVIKFAVVKLTAENTVDIATAVTDDSIGFVINEGQTALTGAFSTDDPVAVKQDGSVLGIASAAIAANAYVSATAGGKLVTSAGVTDRVIGKALTAASADGDLLEIRVIFPSVEFDTIS